MWGGIVIGRLSRGFGAALALALVAVPAQAQKFSDGFSFLKAVKARDGAKVTSLISSPGSVVINNRHPDTGDGGLHMVVRERDSNWLGFLLSKGAKPDLQNNEGSTPLALAAQLGWAEGAELLLARGASVDLANSRGETPLILAVHQRDLPTVRLLLSAGANPNRADGVAGYSALDYARRDRRSAAIARLLETAPAKPAKEAAGPVG